MRKGVFVSGAAVVVSVVTGATAVPAVAGSRSVPGPDGVAISVVGVDGSGCPIDTVAVALKDDAEAFAVTYSDYLARAGGSSIPTDARRNCRVRLKVRVPQEFTYAISQVSYRGYAQLQRGVSAFHNGNYYFQGHILTWGPIREIQGARDDHWSFTDTTPFPSLVWKPCGDDRDLNMVTELRIGSGGSDPSKVSFVTMGSPSDGSETTYRFTWKECP